MYIEVLSLVVVLLILRKYMLEYKFKAGTWAVVTGASDGIGKQFAIQLAKKGLNVLLLARSSVKMDKIIEDCSEFKVEVIKATFDFDTTKDSDWKALTTKIEGLGEISVLINNVGVSHDFPVSFLDEDRFKCDTINRVNIDATLRMTRIVLPHMITKRHGLVLNIGSMLGQVPSSLLSVYSASKAYVRHWSQCILFHNKRCGS